MSCESSRSPGCGRSAACTTFPSHSLFLLSPSCHATHIPQADANTHDPSGEDDLKSTNAPLFNFHDGKLVVDYQKRPLRGTKEEPRDPRLKPITFQQEKALSVVDKLAFEKAISVDQQVGDINFFNNLALLHARSPFVDGEEKQVRRHLTRLIFRDEAEGWSIPEHMKADWARYYEHDSSAETFQEEPCWWA